MDPNTNSEQSLPKRQDLLHDPHGAPGTNDAGGDLALENPCDKYGLGGGGNQTPGAGGTTGPAYGASPYYGPTRDMVGMDIKGWSKINAVAVVSTFYCLESRTIYFYDHLIYITLHPYGWDLRATQTFPTESNPN